MSPQQTHFGKICRATSALCLGVVALLWALCGSGCANSGKELAGGGSPTRTGGRGAQMPELQVQLIPTIQYAAEDFYLLAPQPFTPVYQQQTSLFPGQPLYLVLITRDYAIEPQDGRVSLSYSLSVLDPQGQEHQGPEDVPLYQGVVNRPDIALFPQNIIMFYVEEDHPLGQYTVRVTVHDNVSGKSYPVEQLITMRTCRIPTAARERVELGGNNLIAYEPLALPEGFDPIDWMESYYLNPTPALALPALELLLPMAQADAIEPVYGNPRYRLIGFYDQLLTDNPWLLNYFLAQYLSDAKAAATTGRADSRMPATELVLREHLRGLSEKPEAVPHLLWRELRNTPGLPPAPGHRTVRRLGPWEVELLLGRFFANGSYDPVRQIAEAARLHPSLSPATPASSDRSSLFPRNRRFTTFDRSTLSHALWTLHEQSTSHPLIAAYLRNITLTDTEGFDQRALSLLRSIDDADALYQQGLARIDPFRSTRAQVGARIDTLQQKVALSPDIRKQAREQAEALESILAEQAQMEEAERMYRFSAPATNLPDEDEATLYPIL